MARPVDDRVPSRHHCCRRSFTRRFARAGIVLTLIAGCQSVPQKTQLLESTVPEARISSATLRIWTIDFVLEFADRVAEAADQVGVQTDSRDIQRRALLWKINSVEAALRAASRRDAFAAYVDVWVLCHQMTNFFEHGHGRDLFGPSQAAVLQIARDLEARIEDIGMAMLKPEEAERKMASGRKRVDEFVQHHPLQTLYFQRDSLSGRAESLVLQTSSDFGEIAASLEQDLMTMQRLVAIHGEFMPTLTLWQVQLMLHEAKASDKLADSIAALQAIPAQIQLAASTDVPRVVSDEVTRLQATITAERTAALDAVDAMRLETLAFVQKERDLILDQISRERVATIDELRAERRIVMDEIRAITRDSTASAMSGAKDLVDHFTARLMILIGGLALFTMLGAAGLIILLRTRIRRRIETAASP